MTIYIFQFLYAVFGYTPAICLHVCKIKTHGISTALGSTVRKLKSTYIVRMNGV